MKLLTDEIRRRLPALHESAKDDDPVAHARFLCPWSERTWYVTAFNGRDLLYGLTVEDGSAAEWNYFSLSELETSFDSAGSPVVERDPHFVPAPVSRLGLL